MKAYPGRPRRWALDDLRGRRVLLVASTGGHLTQLTRLAPRLGIDPDSPWVTFDTPQSRSLLAGKLVQHVPYVHPRDWRGIITATRIVLPWLAHVDGVVSTGAGLALAVLPHSARTMPTIYLESISRVQGPSLTGRMLARLPHIGMYAQHTGWLRAPWQPGPSVLTLYRTEVMAAPRPVRRIFVTLGTIRPYRFDRMVDTVLAFAARHPDAEILWQVGVTTRDDLPGRVVTQLGDAEFGEALASSDLVFAHSGVGVAMNILDRGHVPVLMDRRPESGEHVDGHQREILDYLVGRGLAVEASMIATDDAVLQRVLATRVHSE